MSEKKLEAVGISKTIDYDQALLNVSLQLDGGKVYALLGDNGAGRTSLMRILNREMKPDQGKVRSFPGRLTVGYVPHNPRMIRNFTLWQNVRIGSGHRGIWTDQKAKQSVIEQMNSYDIQMNADLPGSDMTLMERQQAAMLRAAHCDVILLDDFLTFLPMQERAKRISWLKRWAQEGKIVLFSSAAPQDRLAADECLILRDGQIVYQGTAEGMDDAKIRLLMTGRETEEAPQKREIAPGSVVLEVRDLTVRGGALRPIVKRVSLEVRAGEILCLLGMEGNGAGACALAVVGAAPITGGRIRFQGKDISALALRERARGISFLPGGKHAFLRDHDVKDNLMLLRYWERSFQDTGVLRKREISRYADDLMELYDIDADGDTPLSALNANERQLLLAARAVEPLRDLLVAVDPAAGVDAMTAREIWQHILTVRENRRAVLLVARNPREAMMIADRILVLRRGEVVAELEPSLTTEKELGLYMSGELRQEKYSLPDEEEEI